MHRRATNARSSLTARIALASNFPKVRVALPQRLLPLPRTLFAFQRTHFLRNLRQLWLSQTVEAQSLKHKLRKPESLVVKLTKTTRWPQNPANWPNNARQTQTQCKYFGSVFKRLTWFKSESNSPCVNALASFKEEYLDLQNYLGWREASQHVQLNKLTAALAHSLKPRPRPEVPAATPARSVQAEQVNHELK